MFRVREFCCHSEVLTCTVGQGLREFVDPIHKVLEAVFTMPMVTPAMMTHAFVKNRIDGQSESDIDSDGYDDLARCSDDDA